MRHVFHPEALIEFSEAALYYSQKDTGLGVAFYTEVENAIQRIIEKPTLFRIIEEDVRRCLTRRFPYGVLYTIREFLQTSLPFLRSREDIRKTYGKALEQLALSLGHEGKSSIESIAFAAERDFKIDITEKSIWGLKYKDIIVHDSPVRDGG